MAVRKKAKKKAAKRKPARKKKVTRKKATRRKTPARKKKVTRKKKATRKPARRKAAGKKTTRKKATKKKAKKKSKRKPNAAFMAPLSLSPELADIVGSNKLPRTQVTKKLWGYIKRRGLQDKINRQMIIADDKLRKIFKKPKVSMFEMTKHVSKHMS